MNFLKEDVVITNMVDYDGLLKFDTDQITNHPEDYVVDLNSKIMPSGISVHDYTFRFFL